MSNLCVIPARGGSKRLPGKNIKELNGKPLLAYSIDAAIESGIYDAIVVSSDDDTILEIGQEYGAIPHKRKVVLSGDAIPVFKVFQNILEEGEYAGKFSTLTGMLPTCPFKKSKHLKEAIELLEKHQLEVSIISVTPFDYPPQFGFSMKESNELVMTHPEVFAKTTRSQNIEPLVHNNGAFWMAGVEHYLKQGTFYKGTMLGYHMDAISSYDIDYPYQFEIAEILAKKIENNEL
jgi:CMP-N-acetylneuraminic acid synthetase